VNPARTFFIDSEQFLLAVVGSKRLAALSPESDAGLSKMMNGKQALLFGARKSVCKIA
jgi:hypothetical protein